MGPLDWSQTELQKLIVSGELRGWKESRAMRNSEMEEPLLGMIRELI